ncbi:PAP2-domain-containing protein [Backusella circina FSU 941]|nr:PAP2-domain-containing protein [Backusella circina FSU 941]
MSTVQSFKLSWLQYPFLASLLLFDIIFIKNPPIWCTLLLATLLALSPLIPYVRRFTVPSMAIFTWLITFYAVQFIPNYLKPQHIFVNLLPTLERIIYGANLSEIISQHTNDVLDILAWLPYGIIHYAFPFIFAFILFIFGPPKSVAVFAVAFGYMNLAGVLTQLLFPTSPPWYELSYGSAPADYSVHGQPGGLARIDGILGISLYGKTFGNSPLVFGAFPSLHSGCATIEMLFLSWLFPKMRAYAVFHVMWMWFATMYLTHHYLIDLVGGSIYATLAFFAFRRHLPVIRPECLTRLDYIESKVPVKRTVGNFIRSIEMEWFVQKLDMMYHEDPETIYFKLPQQHIPLQERRDKVNHITITHREHDNDDDDSYDTSPTCSGPPSPLTPHSPISDVFIHK